MDVKGVILDLNIEDRIIECVVFPLPDVSFGEAGRLRRRST
jgi:hypothetical protein